MNVGRAFRRKEICILVLTALSAILGRSQDNSGASVGAGTKLTIRVALVDNDLNVKPVPRLSLNITPLDGTASPTNALTNLDGSVILKLADGRYRIESSRPV